MADKQYLKPEEVSARYRGEITVGTLRNWRSLGVGPPYTRIGKAILYPVTELENWEKANTILCAPKMAGCEQQDQPAPDETIS